MGIQYHPNVGQVLYCDFSGLKYGEMDKVRPVVVISPRYAQSYERCTVIPLSTTAPPVIRDYHCILERNPIPREDPQKKVWAKCDMMMTVAFVRLSGYWEAKIGDRRQYVKLSVTDNDLKAIRKGTLYALGLGALTAGL